MSKYITIAIVIMSFFGCTQAPPLKVFSIEIPHVQKLKYSPYRDKIVKVIFPESLREQMSEKMNFSYSNSEYGTYLNSEWSNTMGKLLQGTLIGVLEKSRLFRIVLSDSSTLQENDRLESNIFTFEHRVRGERSEAIVSIQFTLIDADTGKLIKTKRFSYKEATPTVDADGYVKATNIVIERLSTDLVKWLR